MKKPTTCLKARIYPLCLAKPNISSIKTHNRYVLNTKL